MNIELGFILLILRNNHLAFELLLGLGLAAALDPCDELVAPSGHRRPRVLAKVARIAQRSGVGVRREIAPRLANAESLDALRDVHLALAWWRL